MEHKVKEMFHLFFLSFVCLAVEAQKPECLITAPNIIHLGVEETVSVQVHGANKDVNVVLYFKDMKDVISERKTVTLNERNQYQDVVRLRVDPTLYSNDNKKKDPYVQLVAESRDLFVGSKMANILLSTKKGYIFIQTDKPIYNPGEQARYRIFTLDNYMLPINDLIHVQIFNSKGLQVHSHILRSEQILQKSVTIPDVELSGHWKITAYFNNYPKFSTSVEFEVREYVLPSFEVKIQARKPYHTLNSASFAFSISARYTYGKGVNGVAYVRFGLVDSKGERTYLLGTEKQITVEDGNADVIVFTSELTSAAANQSKAQIEGLNLYIAATVLEKASGELGEAESSSVKIVTSPYIIDLSRTKQYFSPGGMFSILATTTFPDGSRVPNMKIKATVATNLVETLLTRTSSGDSMGNIVITFQVPSQTEELNIIVQPDESDGDIIITEAKLKSTAIKDEGGSYLSVELQHQILQPGQNLQVTFRDITQSDNARPSHIYYLIVSKGRTLQVNRVQRTELTSINLPFASDMVPSFRLVAYYYTQQGKIVADSVWVDVKDVCKGKVEIIPFNELKPAQYFDVSIRTDARTKVALSAVDSAVYILSTKDKLTPQKMFEYMNSYDLACSIGGGENSQSVLEAAGLTFICTCTEMAPIVTAHKCYEQRDRHKRDLSALVNSYKLPDRKCCEDGRKMGLTSKSCKDRWRYTAHKSQSCREAFLKCCEAATTFRKKALLQRRISGLGRTINSGKEVDEIDEASVYLRSFFPQSWMWTILEADASGNIRHNIVTPDSVTTWEVQAVAISSTQGFCIAEPEPLKVFQDFFISVKLPYSVKRNEQLEVKVVVYNYKQQSLKVTVKMKKVEGLCSAGGEDVVQQVTVDGQSAVSVYFTVVPLIIGNIPINVLAYASQGISDKIKKQLRVVGEGEIVSIYTEHNINAQNKKLEFDIPAPEDEMLGDDSRTMMSFKGGVMGESVNNCLNLEGVNNLIQLPKGCAEQTMVKMSPAIHAMRYLDATNQWLALKAERREEAETMIQAGYDRVLTFKKDDGSYGTFRHSKSSMWLTAFIAKELTESRDIIRVNDLYILQALTYLIAKQKASGAWDDPNPLLDTGMKGGVGKSTDDVPLTAFILITMKHAIKVYELGTDTVLRMAMEKARSYLVSRSATLESPYATAITAYALCLHNAQSPDAQQAHRKLINMSKCDNERCFWDVRENMTDVEKRADPLSVEAAAYGLLSTVVMEDKPNALRVATWLTEQRKYGGGFQSTQDTVVALEALSKFSIQNSEVENLDLSVEICVNNKDVKSLRLNNYNALTQTAFEVKEVGKVVLNVRGRGKGTLSILQTYRSLKNDLSHCDQFHLSVKVDGELEYLSSDEDEEQLDDYYNYDSDEKRDEGMSRMDWFDLRTRRKRQAPEEPKKENKLLYTVCVGLRNGNSSGMVLVDISLLSGLTPNIQDLEDNAKGTEKYIDHYEIHNNKVFLYFDKITEEEQCVRFRVEQIIPIGLIQPAVAVVYDYYNPERRCAGFYTAPKNSPMLTKLCEADVCTCAEGACPRLKVTFSKNMEKNTRKNYACFEPIVDYVYTVRILKSSNDGVFKSYSALTTRVLQTGEHAEIQEGSVLEIIQRFSCDDDVDVKVDGEYLIMGQDESTFQADHKRRFRYLLDSKTWIEEVPPERKCKSSKSRPACQLLTDFMEDYALNKCSV
ncbi:complement C4 [Trichomycterus rosablanca]|uniref:complement C4 n=1 Tax=Trichomycterus rosablanca TaxID=2290929 RepID=UPI002F35695D